MTEKIRGFLADIAAGKNVRAALSGLRAEIKSPAGRRACLAALGGDLSAVNSCLASEDAKTRKNAAGVLGELARQESLDPLWRAYLAEETLFVKSAYLEAMQGLNYTNLLPEMRDIREVLLAQEFPVEERKHRRAELAALTDLIGEAEAQGAHPFAGLEKPAHVRLLTNRCAAEPVRARCEEAGIPAQADPAGVTADPKRLSELFGIRPYAEILFPVPGCESVSGDPLLAANALAQGGLPSLLGEELAGEPPCRFRVEVKSREEAEARAAFAKKFAAQLAVASGGDLINRPSDYEIEVRMIRQSDGSYKPLLKFMNLPDPRFAYRKAVTASSMQPYLAAVLIELAKPYLRDGARVLDPMCGTGTLLIERQFAGPVDTLYGLDISEEALLAAQENTSAAGCFAHYIRRDFQDFSHEYPFDEVITDFPSARGRQSQEEIAELYRAFFRRIPALLKKGSVMALYTHDIDLVRRYAGERCHMVHVYEISKREGSYLAVLAVK